MIPEARNIPPIEQARVQAERMLNSSRRGIQVMRALAQIKSLNLGEEQEDLLSREMEKGFSEVDGYDGRLYQISDDADYPDYGLKGFSDEISETKAVRGLNVHLVIQEIGYECFIMDPNKSRKLWDGQSPGRRQQFARKHVERLRREFSTPRGMNTEFPFDYFLIVSDVGSHYRIDQIMPYH